MSGVAECRGCGKEIVWGVDPVTGKSIPLDPRPAVYAVTKKGTSYEAVRIPGAMVTHFATCPKADRFSKSKKKKAAPPLPPDPDPNLGGW